jgi:hypothetical protein
VYFDDWKLDFLIGRDPLVYIGGGLIPLRNVSKTQSSSFL